MRHNKKGVVLAPPASTYMTAFRYVQDAEARLSETESERADELIRSAYAALDLALHVKSGARKSTLCLAARMAAGLSLRELTREAPVPDAA